MTSRDFWQRLGMTLVAGMLLFGGVLRIPFHQGSSRAQSSRSPTHDMAALLLAAAADLGPVSPNTPLSLVLQLQDLTAAQEARDLRAMYTPGTKTYGHYLTAQDVAARYGPPTSMIARVRRALATLGLVADWQPGDDWLLASGSARSVERAFGVTVRWHRSPRGTRYYAADRASTVPVGLRPFVMAASRLDSDLEPRDLVVPRGGLSPADLLGVYDITPLRDAGLDGTGQTVVFYENDGFSQTQLDTFSARYHLPPLRPIVKAGPTFPEPGDETEMDLEVVHEIAPGARLLIYNQDLAAADRAAHTLDDALTAVLKLQTQMVDENPGAVLSDSWGFCENLYGSALAGAFKNLYDHADAMGESAFAATGDNGAYSCLNEAPRGTPPSPDYLSLWLPSSLPGVTATGGTRLSVSNSSPSGWYHETVWEYPAETGGGGGGVSAFFTRPAWQQGRGVVDPLLNPKAMRSVPDVSADADPASGVSVFIPDGSGKGIWTEGGGTSQAAPIWAGITALINQYMHQKGLPTAGFMNPALYQIAAHPDPAVAFHDITDGTNLHYPATPGYDMASGLGTPDVWNLTQDLERYERVDKR